MRPGSVFVDIAIDQGGCAETSRPTTHDEPVYLEEGVLHYAVANMPGAYARTATQALTNATWLYVQALAGGDLAAACRRMPGLAAGVTVHRGRLACAAVAEAHALDFAPYRAE
jgi:alanine dehydrogenase